MARLNVNANESSITSRLVAMTPYQIYKTQVQGVMDKIRASFAGNEYIPSQFGGLSGQREVITEKVVLQVIDFKAP